MTDANRQIVIVKKGPGEYVKFTPTQLFKLSQQLQQTVPGPRKTVGSMDRP